MGFILFLAAIVTPVTVWRWALWLLCWMGFIGFVLPDLCEPVSRLPKKTKAAGTLITGMLFALAFYPLAHRQWREEEASTQSGDLIGAEDGILENGAPPWVQIGDSRTIFIMTPNGMAKGEPYFRPFPDANFLIESGKKAPLITTTVRDRFGNLVVDIKQNHWTVYPPYCLDKNRTDLAFEAKDSAGHVLLQVQIVGGPPRVQVQGEWWSDDRRGMRILKNGDHAEVIPLVPQMQHNDELIREMFKYPSREHLGEYAVKPRLELPK